MIYIIPPMIYIIPPSLFYESSLFNVIESQSHDILRSMVSAGGGGGVPETWRLFEYNYLNRKRHHPSQ